jgi:hypothetical protein
MIFVFSPRPEGDRTFSRAKEIDQRKGQMPQLSR